MSKTTIGCIGAREDFFEFKDGKLMAAFEFESMMPNNELSERQTRRMYESMKEHYEPSTVKKYFIASVSFQWYDNDASRFVDETVLVKGIAPKGYVSVNVDIGIIMNVYDRKQARSLAMFYLCTTKVLDVKEQA